jgi:hypothetical protein
LILNFVWECKKPRNGKARWKRKVLISKFTTAECRWVALFCNSRY